MYWCVSDLRAVEEQPCLYSVSRYDLSFSLVASLWVMSAMLDRCGGIGFENAFAKRAAHCSCRWGWWEEWELIKTATLRGSATKTTSWKTRKCPVEVKGTSDSGDNYLCFFFTVSDRIHIHVLLLAVKTNILIIAALMVCAAEQGDAPSGHKSAITMQRRNNKKLLKMRQLSIYK